MEDWKQKVLLLKKTAVQKKISQQEIADLTGLHRQAVNRFFACRSIPRLDTYLKIKRIILKN